MRRRYCRRIPRPSPSPPLESGGPIHLVICGPAWLPPASDGPRPGLVAGHTLSASYPDDIGACPAGPCSLFTEGSPVSAEPRDWGCRSESAPDPRPSRPVSRATAQDPHPQPIGPRSCPTHPGCSRGSTPPGAPSRSRPTQAPQSVGAEIVLTLGHGIPPVQRAVWRGRPPGSIRRKPSGGRRPSSSPNRQRGDGRPGSVRGRPSAGSRSGSSGTRPMWPPHGATEGSAAPAVHASRGTQGRLLDG
jgi:hypothetical protein